MSRAWITIYGNFQHFQVFLCLENSLWKAWIPKTEHAIAEFCLMPKHVCNLQTQSHVTLGRDENATFLWGWGEEQQNQFVHPRGAVLGLPS